MKRIMNVIACICVLSVLYTPVEARAQDTLPEELLEQLGITCEDVQSVELIQINNKISIQAVSDQTTAPDLNSCDTYKVTYVSPDDGTEKYFYETTALVQSVSKSSSGQKARNDTTVSGTIYWVDNSGPSNQILSVKMSRTTNHGIASYK